MKKPREVADKSIKGNLTDAIEMSLGIESEPVRRNTQTFNRNRYTAVSDIEDYEDLKDEARKIKEYSIENQSELLKQLEEAVKANGGKLYLAKDAEAACGYISRVCLGHKAKLVVKGKSITSEEIKLNSALEKSGIEVAETDLAEFILQYSNEQPSHIVAPAIHQSRERISKLFKDTFNPDVPLETGEELTKFARAKLREKFLNADVGITGANVIAADTGTIALVESEGNIRLSYSIPRVHIALAGIEKVIPHTKDLATFIELLAPSGTGQPLTSYTSFIRPPLELPLVKGDDPTKLKREFHLVLIDNGRSAMRNDPELREALYCIRCSACMNSCANFQVVGGHSFGGETYTGGIGGAWEAGTGNLEKASFSELCTGCSRCVPQCPVRIDIPRLNEVLKQRLNDTHKFSAKRFQKGFFANFAMLARLGTMFGGIPGKISNSWVGSKVIGAIAGISSKRNMPALKQDTFEKQYKVLQNLFKADSNLTQRKAVIFADVYTNYQYPERGMALVNILNKLGVRTEISSVLPEGRASLSQGLIRKAAGRAKRTANHLKKWIDNGYDIIAIEPSVLALFTSDYKYLLKDKELMYRLNIHSYEPLEYIQTVLTDTGISPGSFFDMNKAENKNLFYHAHCQLKTIGAERYTIQLLVELGFDIEVSQVECCGMAGSFGYKKDFYELSRRVGEDLFDQIRKSEKDGERVVLASGISCRDQVFDGLGRNPLHPLELLEKLL